VQRSLQKHLTFQDDADESRSLDSLRACALAGKILAAKILYKVLINMDSSLAFYLVEVNKFNIQALICLARRALITKEKIMMNKSFGVLLAALFSANLACAQATAPATPAAPAKPATPSTSAMPAASNCEAQAVSKNGKPLAGAAKASFMKKCEAGSASTVSSSCEAKAVGKNGKPLAGAAKASFMKKCEKEG
jgi:hypothetical protein